MNWDFYSAVIFLCITRRETGGIGKATEASYGHWTCPRPDLTCSRAWLFHPRQQATEAEPERSAAAQLGGWRGSAEVLQMGTKELHEAHRGDNVGRVGLGTNVLPPLPGHLTFQSTVIWTKNIGLSFLLPFSEYCGYFLQSCGSPEWSFALIKAPCAGPLPCLCQ